VRHTSCVTRYNASRVTRSARVTQRAARAARAARCATRDASRRRHAAAGSRHRR
jgi:hypothetical protein